MIGNLFFLTTGPLCFINQIKITSTIRLYLLKVSLFVDASNIESFQSIRDHG